MTVGAFIKEKLGNMACWVTEELGEENISFDIRQSVADLHVLEATMLAEVLHTHSTKITHRDWSGLIRALSEEKLRIDLASVVHAVRAREKMHDKFWRYLELFRAVIQNSNS